MTTSVTPRGSSPRSVAGTPRSAAAAARRLRKQCTAADCAKVDAGGGFCVAHGGGKKCAFPGCHKGYQTGGFCRQHGGGARCQVDGCGKVDAGRGLCRAHGGGKRCQETGCTKADVGGGFCTAHGGGRRCAEPGCTKIDQGGGKCRAHGGARRCRHDGCAHPARGASGLCSDHGGAQLCATPNCRRIAKAEGGQFCASCAKSRVDSEIQAENKTVNPSADDAPSMPPFGEMLARTSPRYEYAPLVADGMEPFHAFVQAATNASVTSPPLYRSEDLEEVRSPRFQESPSVEEEPQDDRDHEANQEANLRKSGSCLDNGCSKSFGGRCNCKAGCTCCSRARASESDAQTGDTTEPSSAAVAATTRSPPVVSFLPLQRVKLIIHKSKLPLSIVVSMLKAVRGVRSVHTKPTNSSLGREDEEDEEGTFSTVLRCDPEFDLSGLEVLAHGSEQYEVHDTSTVDWSLKEIVLRVPDMMCPGNCGRTVMNALQPISAIHTANLVFDERCVIARGDMSAQQLCEAIEAVGFEPGVVVELPLPKRFTFRVVDFASVYLMENRLRNLFLEVEGVETVLCAVNRAEVLVEATLPDAGSLLQAAHARGIMIVEIQEDVRDIQASPFDPTNVGRPCHELIDRQPDQSNTTEGSDHVCDVKVCPHNGCEQYRVTIAHTAALAVGWSVPGCAMGWGGECTCGEACKCAGCPEHNPLT